MSSISKINNICKVDGKLMEETYINKKYNNKKFAKKDVPFPVTISFHGYGCSCSLLESNTEVDIL